MHRDHCAHVARYYDHMAEGCKSYVQYSFYSEMWAYYLVCAHWHWPTPVKAILRCLRNKWMLD